MEKTAMLPVRNDNLISLATILNKLILKDFHFKFIELVQYGLTTIAIFVVMLYLFPAHMLILILFFLFFFLTVLFVVIERADLFLDNKSHDYEILEPLDNSKPYRRSNKFIPKHIRK